MSIRKMMAMGMFKREYYEKIRALFGSSLIGYWPLLETTGTVAKDISGNGWNATIEGSPSLSAALSLSGKPCIYFDGSNGKYISLNSQSAFLNSVSFDEGGYFCRFKPDTAMLTDTTNRALVTIKGNSNETIKIDKGAVNYQFTTSRHNGTSYDAWNAIGGFSSNLWHDIIITWSKSGGLMKAFVDGNLFVSSAISTSIAAHPNQFIIGAIGTTGAVKGYLSDCGYVNRLITDTEATKMRHQTIKTISIIGDSLSTDLNGWDKHLAHTYKNGMVKICNHAVGGQSIVANFAAQVAAAASDNADLILIQMGVNDNNAGNMATLSGIFETGIDALRLSNPNAIIIDVNVFPAWTDVGGGTPVDKSNIRTALFASCTAKGVTCIDTFTSAWITSAKTTDGKHHTPDGYYEDYTNIATYLP